MGQSFRKKSKSLLGLGDHVNNGQTEARGTITHEIRESDKNILGEETRGTNDMKDQGESRPM